MDGNYIITIGRELGSGGALIGKKIAEHFGFQYLDREILVEASKKLEIPEQNVEIVEEKVFSMWSQFFPTAGYESPYLPEYYVPTSRKLYETETAILKATVKKSSCVLVGRCGNWIFKDDQKHVSVFLHAQIENRIKNLMEIYKISAEEAKDRISKTDKDRSRYYATYTGEKWLDLRGYDLSVDTGKLGIDKTGEVIIHYIKERFPEIETTK